MPMIIKLVKKGKPVYIKDVAFVDNIKNTIKKQKINTVNELNRKIKDKETKLKNKIDQMKQAKDTSQITTEDTNNHLLDTFNIIKLLIEAYKETHTNMRIDIFNNYIDKLLNTTYSKDCIFVTSIHCVKGLEAPNCFILNKGEPTISGPTGFMTKEQRIQEMNLSYVALTRAQENLYLVKPEGEEYGSK
jgi:superfamily I DNA/RNA helicase